MPYYLSYLFVTHCLISLAGVVDHDDETCLTEANIEITPRLACYHTERRTPSGA